MYQKEFKKAVERTKSFQLETPNIEYFSGSILSDDKMANFPYLFRDAVGLLNVKEIVAQCLSIHYRIKEPIANIFNTPCYFTIGYVEEDGERMFYQSEENLKDILMNGFNGFSLSIHAWLTLPTMEILDFTLPTTNAVIRNDEKILVV